MEFIGNIFELITKRYDFFIELILEHILLSGISILIISALGFSIGIFMSGRERIAEIILGMVNFMYTMPSIALFGILITITGPSNLTAVIALVLYGLMPMIRNTYVGIKDVDKDIVDAAVGMGSTDNELMWKIRLPLAMPVIMAGFRTMVVMTIALAGIASFIGAGGLGVAIWRGITTNYKEMTLVGSVLVALLAVLSDYLISKAENKVRERFGG